MAATAPGNWMDLACARFFVGPNVKSLVLPESQIWVEYTPTATFGDLLQNVKNALGITADVSLYLQSFYLPPTLSASLLLKVQDPVVCILPSGQTKQDFSLLESGGDVESVGTPPPESKGATNEANLEPKYFSTPIPAVSEHLNGNKRMATGAGEKQLPRSSLDATLEESFATPDKNTSFSFVDSEDSRIYNMSANSIKSSEDDIKVIASIPPKSGAAKGQKRGRKQGRKVNSPQLAAEDEVDNAEKENEVADAAQKPITRRSTRFSNRSLETNKQEIKIPTPKSRKRSSVDSGSMISIEGDSKRQKSSSEEFSSLMVFKNDGRFSPDVSIAKLPTARGGPKSRRKSLTVYEYATQGASPKRSETGKERNGVTPVLEHEIEMLNDGNTVEDSPTNMIAESGNQSSVLTSCQELQNTAEVLIDGVIEVAKSTLMDVSASPNPDSIIQSADQLNRGDVIEYQLRSSDGEWLNAQGTRFRREQSIVFGKEGNLLTLVPPSAQMYGGIDPFAACVRDFSELLEPRLVPHPDLYNTSGFYVHQSNNNNADTQVLEEFDAAML